jgi:hypothetical protein
LVVIRISLQCGLLDLSQGRQFHGSDGRLAVIELGKAYLGVGLDEAIAETPMTVLVRASIELIVPWLPGYDSVT